MGLSRFKVRTRIFAGFGFLVLLSAVLAAFTLLQLGAIRTQVSKMTALQANVTRVMEADHAFETIRRGLTRYRIEQDEQSATDAREASAAIEKLITEAAAATISEERRRLYREVLDSLRGASAEINEVIAGFKAAGADRAKLFTGGDTLTAATGELVAAARATKDPAVIEAAGRAEAAVLLVRVANWRFLATQDPKGPATFHTNVSNAEAAIVVLEHLAPDLRGLVAPVRGILATYAESFEGYSTVELRTLTLYDDKMRPQIKTMQEKLRSAGVSLKQEFDTAVGDSDSIMSSTTLWQMALAGIGVALGVALALIIGRGITIPLGLMTGAMTKLAEGDQTIDVPARDNTDEIGDMARAVEVFKQNAFTAGRLAAEQEAARAARSRRQDAMDRHTQEFGATITEVMASLASSADNMRRASDAMSAAASAVHDEASVTTEAASKSSQDLTAVAAAVEELSSSVEEISRQVATAANVARQAVDRAEASRSTMQSLSEATARIGDVVHLISDIAGQTNLLALNATIEAARAGEAGRGFAVVAGEVKTLAAQTAKATAEIGGQIDTVRGATGDAVNAMTEISTIIGKMDEVAAAISAAVEEQGATTREIASSIQAVSGATAQTAQAMGHVVVVADGAGGASRDVQTGAAEIGHEAELLRGKVDQFLEAVRSDSGERRRSERLAGNGVNATLRVPGRADARVVLHDLSRDGAALISQPVPIGARVELDLPDAGGVVHGQVARCENGVVGVTFRGDADARTRVDRVLRTLSAGRAAA